MFAAIANSWNDRLLRLAFLCITLMGIAVAAINPFQSVIGIERLGFSPSAYALITTLGALFSVAASVYVGVYTDQTGKYRSVLAGCNLIGTLGAACVFFLPSKATFILAHMVLFPVGATTFTQYFAMASLAANNNAKLDKDLSLSLVRAAFAGAFGLTPPLLAVAVAGGMELMSVYGVAAGVNAFVLFLVLRTWPKEQTSLNQKSGIGFVESLKELARGSVLIRLVLIAVIVGVNGLNNILLGLLILNNLGGTASDLGLFAGGVALMEVPVMIGAAVALKRVSSSGLIFVGCIVYCCFLAAFSSLPNMGSAWGMIVPAGIGAGILLSVTVGYIQDLVASRPGAGSSLVSVSHFGGAMFASGMFAFGAVFTDYQGTAVIGSVIGLAAGITLFVMDGARFRRSHPVVS
ncbi:MFS transporter [Planktotalea sp.]|uniref:MFS transporter n=1 Tax=Planktotalea sp. TaxID=2029877 RepID=UPI0032976232